MTERQDSHKVELVWEGSLEPTGTLFRDDLEELETLLRSEHHDIDISWTLEGKRHRGSAKITAPTINEVIEHRHELVASDTLELRAQWYPPSTEDEEYYRRFHGVFEASIALKSTGWGSDEKRWTARIITDHTLRQEYERCQFGVDEIFKKASQTTWVRTHKKARWAASNMWLLLWPVTTLVAYPAALVLLHEWWAIPTEWWQTVGLIWALYALVYSLLDPLKKRVDANASWQAPHFDLASSRSQEALAAPPEIIRRDVALAVSLQSLVSSRPSLWQP